MPWVSLRVRLCSPAAVTGALIGVRAALPVLLFLLTLTRCKAGSLLGDSGAGYYPAFAAVRLLRPTRFNASSSFVPSVQIEIVIQPATIAAAGIMGTGIR